MIGDMDRRVVIQARSVTENAFGEEVESWADVRTESASYSPGSGAERRISAQERSEHPATFVFHSNALTKAMTPQSHRLTFDGGIWDIHSNVEIGRGRKRSIIAIRRVS